MRRITNLEDILHEYKFVPKSKPVFRKRIILVDDLPETGTKAGHIGYAALVRMLYDIEAITGEDVNRIIDELDQIMSSGEVY